jgi:hypothetical protein
MAKQSVNIGSVANDGTGDTLRAAYDKLNDNDTEIYSLLGNGTTLSITGDVSVSSGAVTIANDAVEQAMIADDAVGADQLASSAVVTASIVDDNVTHDKLEGRYTALETITTTSGTINLDGATYAAFHLTGNLGTATLNIQNMKKGQVIDILLSGTLSSAAITLADSFTTSTINKVGSTALDTSKTNLIQVLCVDDNDSAAILTYAVADYAVNTTV